MKLKGIIILKHFKTKVLHERNLTCGNLVEYAILYFFIYCLLFDLANFDSGYAFKKNMQIYTNYFINILFVGLTKSLRIKQAKDVTWKLKTINLKT